MIKKEIIYPGLGLLSLLVGILIVTSGISVHSGLFAIGIIGFLILLPLILLVKSVQSLLRKPQQEKSKTRNYAKVLVILLSLLWGTLMIMGAWR